MRALSLSIAATNLMLATSGGVTLFTVICLWVCACMPMIWCSDQMSRWHGLFYVSAMTGESRKSIVLQTGWVLLALPGLMLLASLLVHR
jgi:hypothetical protein